VGGLRVGRFGQALGQLIVAVGADGLPAVEERGRQVGAIAFPL